MTHEVSSYDEKKASIEIAHVDNVEDGQKYDDGGILPVEDLTPEMDRTLRRKADMCVLPLMMLMYGLQYLDKMSMAYAVIMGFRKDRNITLSQYSWLSSIFREPGEQHR